MKRTLICLLGLALAGLAQATPLPAKADVLATNTVVAEYTGTIHMPCRFMTALCPDKCDHASDIAQFRVLENVDYTCPSEYGDEKAAVGSTMMVEAKKNVVGQDDAKVHQVLSELKPGDKVRLTVTHYYVSDGYVSEPARPVTSIEVLPAK